MKGGKPGLNVRRKGALARLEVTYEAFKKAGEDKNCVEYYFYNEDNLPVQSFAFVIATSDEEAIQKAQNYSTSKITIISCTKYA